MIQKIAGSPAGASRFAGYQGIKMGVSRLLPDQQPVSRCDPVLSIPGKFG